SVLHPHENLPKPITPGGLTNSGVNFQSEKLSTGVLSPIVPRIFFNEKLVGGLVALNSLRKLSFSLFELKWWQFLLGALGFQRESKSGFWTVQLTSTLLRP
ncbi:hypothetical protein Ancab_028385, partial [Ancistrocladus abbreviatus]